MTRPDNAAQTTDETTPAPAFRWQVAPERPRADEFSRVQDRDADGYADIASYASIGDRRTVALVARDGRIDWLPLADLDSTPAFGALLDAELGGYIALAPVDDYEVSRRYLPGTDVLETTFRTAEGVARVTDALTTGIGGELPWRELGRRIDGIEGHVHLRAAVVPGTLLRTASPWVSSTVHGDVLRVDGLTMAVRTLHDDGVDVLADRILADYRTSPGSRHLLGLVSSDDEPLSLPDPEEVDRRVLFTIEMSAAWGEAFPYDGPHADEVLRSVQILRQLLVGHGGAVAAAATTSLPESAVTPKNWDYRFSWVRDAAFTLAALYQFGVRQETHSAMSWMLRQIRDLASELVVLTALDGSRPGQDVIEHDVPGWRGSKPVTTGNRASDQVQLGVYGDLFNIVGMYVEYGNVLDERTARMMSDLANQAADMWRMPDSGIWELEEIRQYTTSKLGCWQALDHAVRLAEAAQIPGEPARWRRAMEQIHDWVEENCWSEELGGYEFYPGSGTLDASILLHAISGFDRGERMSRTLDMLRRDLGAGPHLYRYGGAETEEGTFVACSYWMVAALVHVGREDEARELLDQLIAATPSDVGVLAEMIDAETGASVGNVPQALSHLALINAALTVESDGAVSTG